MEDVLREHNRQNLRTQQHKKARISSLHRQQRCWELSLRCWTQQEIADELGLKQMQVSRHLSKAKARLNQELTDRVSEYKIDQLDKLHYIIGEAMAAWREAVANSKPNPKLLTEARGAMRDVRDLLGLNAPIETVVNFDAEAAGAEMDAEDKEKDAPGQ